MKCHVFHKVPKNAVNNSHSMWHDIIIIPWLLKSICVEFARNSMVNYAFIYVLSGWQDLSSMPRTSTWKMLTFSRWLTLISSTAYRHNNYIIWGLWISVSTLYIWQKLIMTHYDNIMKVNLNTNRLYFHNPYKYLSQKLNANHLWPKREMDKEFDKETSYKPWTHWSVSMCASLIEVCFQLFPKK